MKNINFGIVGFGSISKTHALSAFDANLRLDLPYCINPTAALTRTPVDIKLPNMKNYQNFEQMIGAETLDFIDICTPNQNHLEYVERAISSKVAIYCEKPLAESLAAAQKMTDLAQHAKIRTAVTFMYRFIPAVNILKNELKKGTIGKIINFRLSTYHSSYLNPKKSGTWRTSSESGGGALLDLGVHLIDLVHYIIGDIKEIKANTKIHFTSRSCVDEYAFCNVVTDNEVNGTIEVSRISAETDNRDEIELYGEKGSFKVNLKKPYTVEYNNAENNCTTFIYAANELLKKLHYPAERAALGFFQSAHTACLVEFADSIYNNRVSEVSATFEDGLKSQKVIEMAYSKT